MKAVPYSLFGLCGLVFPIIGVILPDLARDFGVGVADIGFVATLMVAMFALFLLVASSLMNSLGAKRPVIVSLVIMAVASACMFLFKSQPAFTIGAALIGLASGIQMAAANWYMVHRYLPHERAGKLNLLNLFFSAGGFLSPISAGLLLKVGVHWSTLYAAISLICLGMVAWVSTLREDTMPQAAATPTDAGLSDVAAAIPKKFLRFVVICALGLFTYVFSEYVFTNWIVTWGRNILGMPIDQASALLSLFWLTMAIGRGLASQLIAKLGEKRYLLLCLAASTIIALATFALRDSALLFAGSIMLGFTFAGVYPTLFALALIPLHHVPRSVLTVLSGIGPVGGMIAMLASSMVMKAAGLEATFALCFSFAIICLGLVIFVFQTSTGRTSIRKSPVQ